MAKWAIKEVLTITPHMGVHGNGQDSRHRSGQIQVGVLVRRLLVPATEEVLPEESTARIADKDGSRCPNGLGRQQLAVVSQRAEIVARTIGVPDLSATKVTGAGLEHLKGLTSLRDLDLTSTQVTDDGDKELQEALLNCKIRH